MSFVLIRQLLVNSWVGAGHQKDQGMIRSFERSAPPYHPLQGREGKLEIEFRVTPVYMRKPP